MIFIKERVKNICYFPKNYQSFGENEITLILKSELTLKSYSFDHLISVGYNKDYVILEVDFTDVEEGEYIYSLQSGKYNSVGLIRIGEIKSDISEKTYNNTETIIEYKY